ncbi:hypothetical protein FS749_005263 [Ceratobasidium sp. UAMH 11750]|nr:hypothetical protein FS749_005263 [Ceratobasidium sp. UAMH 11750]
MDPYLCMHCFRPFKTVTTFRAHTKGGILCHDQKPVLRSEYKRQLQENALTAGRPVATSSGFGNADPTPSCAPIPLSSDPTPSCTTTTDPVHFQPDIIPPTENGWDTHNSSWLFDPSLFQSFDPSIFQSFDPLPTLDLHPPVLNNCESGTLERGLTQNPWAENTNEGWRGAGDANVAWDNSTTQTFPNGQEGFAAGPGPGPEVMGGDASNVRAYVQMASDYIQIVDQDRVIYRHCTAGQSFGKCQTRWEAEHKKNDELRGGNPYGMWASKDEWEAVKWLATTKVSQSSINELLKTERFRDAKYSFKNAKSLFKKIEKEMGGFGGPKWNAEDIILPGAPHDKATLFYRKLDECGDFMFGRPQFAGKMTFAPEMHYDLDETTRLYDNPWTADDWNERQKTLPAGTTLGGILIASDSTQLSMHSGDVAAHAVYMSLTCLGKETRASTSENGWILVAYIPKSKFTDVMATVRNRPKAVQAKILGALNRRLFHRCMEVITRPLRRPVPHDVVDPEGNIRSVLYELAGYIADLEEQWLVAGLGGLTCPHCTRDANHLGDVESGLPRTPGDVLRKIRKIKRDYKSAWGRSPSIEEFVTCAAEEHLNGVDKPFWKTLPQVNIFNLLSPDLLHGFHKFFYDHIYRFNRTGMGDAEYDARVRAQTHFVGDRTFQHGVSHISQMTGIEHRLLERTHLPIVANAPGKINDKVTRATQGAMECIYLAQLPVQSERSLQAYETTYESLMACRQGWIENGTRKGKNGIIKHFNIPKMHIIRHHVEHVRRKGTADNFSTETMEHLHVGVKEAYRASNHREWKEWTTRWMNRREMVRDFEAWRLWCRAKEQESHGLEDDNPEVWTEDGSENSSVSAQAEEATGGNSCEDEDEGEASVSEEEDKDEYDDPDAYGERLVDGGDEEEREERGQARADRVRGWLKQQAGVEVGSGGSRKRKRRADLDNPNQRSRPRPRLQDTHGISDLQKVNLAPSIRRKPICQVCELYNLDLGALMHQVGQSAYLADLPIPVDEYTQIDVWHALRTRLPSAARKSGLKMQQIRAKPATRGHAAKFDPVLYVDSEGKTPRTAKLHGELFHRPNPPNLPTHPNHSDPQPPNDDVLTHVQQDSTIDVQGDRNAETDGRKQYRIVPASEILRLCPLAPVIHGPAPLDVNRDNVLERFTTFYLNKYRNVDDYMFMSDVL